MKLLKFLFTARMSFLWFTLLAFACTFLYFAWIQHHEVGGVQPPAATHTR